MEKTEFTYEYENRNGHPVPKTTIAVVPLCTGGDEKLPPTHFAIGWSWCSKRDNPHKKRGRQIAHARAHGVVNARGLTITTPNGATIARLFGANEISVATLGTCGFTNPTIDRILKSVEHLLKVK